MSTTSITTRGRNITYLQQSLLKKIDPSDLTRVMEKAADLVSRLPSPKGGDPDRQGLLLGLIQSGKTVAITTSIAMAADNGYTCFVVLTSDNTWLYNQTVERLKEDLQMLEVVEKENWERGEMFMPLSLKSPDPTGVVLVATKNTTVLSKLSELLDRLRMQIGGAMPTAVVFDDEADQASLDTQKSRQVKNPSIAPGRINSLINEIRSRFANHAFIQVTATPQALFLQEESNLYRPEFTTLLEPGKGYIGGKTFFSLIEGDTRNLIRTINQAELDALLLRRVSGRRTGLDIVPQSLRLALCTFYIGATLKHRQKRLAEEGTNSIYSFLCHISEKMADHDLAYDVISQYYIYLRNGLTSGAPASIRLSVVAEFQEAYDEVMTTFSAPDKGSAYYSFEEVFGEIQEFIAGTDIQTINSGADQERPRYSKRYNILIGGTKLSRGVTIDGLIVTYYGRQAKRPNMDTVLQHARMYGYREADLDVTRLFVTPDVETRFRLINESEEALREVIEKYPGKEYRGIRLGRNLNATRRNVYNPNNTGAYGAGKAYFPTKPNYLRAEVGPRTEQLNKLLMELHPSSTGPGVSITAQQMIDLLKLTSSDPRGIGLWDDKRIIAALETLYQDKRYNNQGWLVVRRDRRLRPNVPGQMMLRSFFGGETSTRGSERTLAQPNVPTLFMYRLTGEGWDGASFWLPNVVFPDGEYALMFNFE